MKKMNNNGQALIMFVLLLPLIILVFAYMIESANIMYNKTRIQNIIVDSCDSKNSQEYILKNIPDASIIVTSDKITVLKEIDSTIANIIGIDTFTIKVTKICESGD